MTEEAPVRRSRQTIRDVAEAAGVSIGTVSKALNNSGTLSAETRARIIKLAGELGFRPNDLAQSLHRGQSFTVGLISNDSFGRFTLPILEGLERELADRRIAIFMCNATDDPERERQHLDQLLGKRIDGLVVTARRADKRPPVGPLPPGLPVIYVYSQADDGDALSLLADEDGGARLAVRHLRDAGCSRIAHVTGPEHFEAVQQRKRGYYSALAEGGLAEHPGYYLSGLWSEAWGRDAVTKLFAGDAPPPDGIFCGNDQIARGVVDALRERGVAVPGEVAVVGFDNWEVMTTAARPPLTSVDMNLSALGHEAGRMLIEMIGGEKMRGIRRLPCTLVVRESTNKQIK